MVPKSKTKSNSIQTGKQKMRAFFEPSTYDAEARTMDVVWSTGAGGKRGYYDPFMEELSMKKNHIRLERLNAGAPVLNNHSSYSLESSLGVVDRAWIKESKGHATIRFSKREKIQGIIQDIVGGVIRNLSVGYIVHEYTDVSKKKDEIRTLRATDWEPYELSFVNIPFETEAQSRSVNDEDKYETKIINNREIEMENENTDETVETKKETVAVDQTSVDNDNTRDADIQKVTKPVETKTEEPILNERDLEKTRGIVIRKMVKDHSLDEEFASEMVANDVTVDNARELVLKKLSDKSSETVTNNHNVEVKDVDNKKLRMEAASNALIHRASGGAVELKDGAREYRGMTLTRMAEKVLNDQNIKTNGMTGVEIAERALMHSSDFVEILSNVANKSLRAGYDEQPQTFASFTREVQVNDFKEISRVQLSDAPKLEKVNESGEFKHGKMSESAEKYRIGTYGKIVGITRQTLVNDDMDAFSRIPQLFGASARDLETELVYKELASNPIMSDGNALFSAAHGNLGTASLISVASVAAGRLAMRLQKGLTDKLIRVRATDFLVPATLETMVEQFLGPIVATKDSDVNPFKSKLGLISDAELDAYSQIAWYLMANKSTIDMFEIARLAGQSGPMMSQKVGFDVDGIQMKVVYDFGVKAIDWRGMFKNPGL